MQIFRGKATAIILKKTLKNYFEKILKKFKKRLDIYARSLYNSQVTYPGVAKFGIALDWGSRGRRFKSCHSDHIEYS